MEYNNQYIEIELKRIFALSNLGMDVDPGKQFFKQQILKSLKIFL